MSQDDQPPGRPTRQSNTAPTNDAARRWTGNLRRWVRSWVVNVAQRTHPSPEREGRGGNSRQTNPPAQLSNEVFQRSPSRGQPPSYDVVVSPPAYDSHQRPPSRGQPPAYDEVISPPAYSGWYTSRSNGDEKVGPDRRTGADSFGSIPQSSEKSQRSSPAPVQFEEESWQGVPPTLDSHDEAALVTDGIGGRSYRPTFYNSGGTTSPSRQARRDSQTSVEHEDRGDSEARPGLDRRARDRGCGQE